MSNNCGLQRFSQCHDGNGFVLCLALHGQTDAVHILLSRGSYQRDDRDSCGTTPLMDALRAGFVDVAKLLIQQQLVRILCHCCVKLIDSFQRSSSSHLLSLARSLAELYQIVIVRTCNLVHLHMLLVCTRHLGIAQQHY